MKGGGTVLGGGETGISIRLEVQLRALQSPPAKQQAGIEELLCRAHDFPWGKEMNIPFSQGDAASCQCSHRKQQYLFWHCHSYRSIAAKDWAVNEPNMA